MGKNIVRNIVETDPRKMKYTLDSEVRADERKKQAMFDIIHILSEHNYILLTDEEIVEALVERCDVENEAEGWLWLRRYKEKQMDEVRGEYSKQTARLTGEIDEINKTLARIQE